MEIRLRPLEGSPLVAGWQEERPEVIRFFPGAPGSAEAYRDAADEVDGRFTRPDRERAAGMLEGGGADGPARLRGFVEEDGLLVTTGQQPGLFGGPLYTLYKAYTAAALAGRLEALLERPVLPVFWIASEDHDWEEARVTHVLDRENELREVGLPPRAAKDAPPLHALPLGKEVKEALRRYREFLPETDFSVRWLELLGRTHVSGTTLPRAFQEVLEEILGPRGIFFVQSHQPALKSASLPLLLRELEEAELSEQEVRARGGELEAAGLPLQVPMLEGATNLFLEGPGGRERVFRDGDGTYRLRHSGLRLTRAEVEDRVGGSPGALSPNVLLRPVVEAAVLPTIAYVAGPGEGAYFPQTTPLFRRLGVGMPVLHPRASMVVVERKVGKVLEKFSLPLEDLSRPHHEVAGRLIRDEIPDPLRGVLGSLRGDVARGTRELAEAVREVDPTLEGPVEHVRNQAFGLLDEVEKKVVQSLKREREIALAQLEKAQLHIFPLGRPQERVLNPFYYLVRYDEGFLTEVGARAAEAVLP